MIALYKIDNELLKILNNPNPETGELDAEALENWGLSRFEKQKNIALYIKDMDYGVSVIDAEMKRLREMKESAVKKSDWLKDYLKRSMDLMDEKSLDFGPHTVKIVNNPPSVMITNDAALPTRFARQVIEIKPDKVAIRDAIKSGEDVPGAMLVQEERIVIK